MLTPAQEAFIREHAYIPEHSIGLMAHLSGGEPHVCDDCLCFLRGDWLALVGYPLSRPPDPTALAKLLPVLAERFGLQRVSVIAPELPEALVSQSQERDSDHYFTLAAAEPALSPSVRRNLKNARSRLTFESAAQMGPEHAELFQAFLERAAPSPRVRILIERLPAYVKAADEALVLNARDHRGRLNAFYVVDMSAATFANYIIGCYSKDRYVRGASDLLMWETIQAARNGRKRFIHLGLGVNPGVRRFKQKWGAAPSRAYEMIELVLKRPSLWEVFKALRSPR